MASENWLAGFANYESWTGDSENEGSPDLDQMFADAHEFRRARAAEAAQVSASTPPLPSPEPAITGPEDAPTRERVPTVPPAPMSDATRNACIREFVAACEPLSSMLHRATQLTILRPGIPPSGHALSEDPMLLAGRTSTEACSFRGTRMAMSWREHLPAENPEVSSTSATQPAHAPTSPEDHTIPKPRQSQRMPPRPKNKNMLKTMTRAWWQQPL